MINIEIFLVNNIFRFLICYTRLYVITNGFCKDTKLSQPVQQLLTLFLGPILVVFMTNCIAEVHSFSVKVG